MKQESKLKYIVSPEWKDHKLHSFLCNEVGLSRTRIRQLKKNGGIRLNGEVAFTTRRLLGGEELTLRWEVPVQAIQPEEAPLDIVYEDSDLVVVNKPAGMVVHPVKKHQQGTLANILVGYWQRRGEAAGFHPVHRLDKTTSGLIVIAKNAIAHQRLDKQIAARQLHRLYLAVCQGDPCKSGGRIDAPVLDLPDSARRIIDPQGRPALTRYRVLKRYPDRSLVAVKLYTGRTHQIRIHFAHLGLPLWGDELYGFSVEGEKAGLRPALHSVRLRFRHPRSGELMRFTAKMPEDFGRMMDNT